MGVMRRQNEDEAPQALQRRSCWSRVSSTLQVGPAKQSTHPRRSKPAVFLVAVLRHRELAQRCRACRRQLTAAAGLASEAASLRSWCILGGLHLIQGGREHRRFGFDALLLLQRVVRKRHAACTRLRAWREGEGLGATLGRNEHFIRDEVERNRLPPNLKKNGTRCFASGGSYRRLGRSTEAR